MCNKNAPLGRVAIVLENEICNFGEPITTQSLRRDIL